MTISNSTRQSSQPLLILLWSTVAFFLTFEIIALIRPADFEISEALAPFFNPLFLCLCAVAALVLIHLKSGFNGLKKVCIFSGSAFGPLYLITISLSIRLSWWFIGLAFLLFWLFAWSGLWLFHKNHNRSLKIWFASAVSILLYLYLDRIFYMIFKLHLGLMHIWRLKNTAVENSHLGWENISPYLFDLAAFATVSLLILYALPRPSKIYLKPFWPFAAIFVQLMCLVTQFDFVIENRPFVEYLMTRFEASGLDFPLCSTLKPLQEAGLDKSNFRLNPDTFYRNHDFTWKSGNRPNLIFLTLESVRADEIEKNMPNLMKWSNKGLYFNRHFSASNITETAINSVYGSMYPFFVAEQFHKIEPWSFISFLKDSDYSLTKVYTLMTAFYHDAFYKDFEMIALPKPTESDPTINYLPFEWFSSVSEKHLQILSYSSETILNEVLKIAASRQRYFIEGYLFNGHFNYNYPANFARFQPTLPEKFMIHQLQPSPENLLMLKNRYRNALGYVDHCLNKFLTEFYEKKLNENTYIVILGDHGQSLGEDGFFAHVSGPHIFQFQVPCVILGPKIKPGVYTDISQHVDILPTLGELMQFEAKGAFGKNLFKEKRQYSLEQENSIIDRFIIRREKMMSIYDITGNRRVRWVITIGNQFELTPEIMKLYSEPGIVGLKALIREDLAFIKKECRL